MRLQIRSPHLKLSEDARASVKRRLQFALARFSARLTLVTVHLTELNVPHGEANKHCRIVGRLVRAGELVTEATDASLDGVVARAADRMERAVRREIDRRRDRKANGENGVEVDKA